MSKNKVLLPIILLLSLCSCSFVSTSSDSSTGASILPEENRMNNPQKAFNSEETSISSRKYVSSVNSLSEDFYQTIFDGENQVFSPISIATCFSMLLDGTDGNSKAELEAFLHYDGSFNHLDEIKNMLLRNAIDDEEAKTYLDLAQSLWIDNSFKDGIDKTYVQTMQDYYFAELFNGKLDSSIMHKALADYINQKTRDFLELTEKDFEDFEGILWLLNTIYLKSSWVNEFPKENNYTNTFYNLDGKESRATYMSQETDAFYTEYDDYAISSLSFKKGMSLNILLPDLNTDYQAVLTDQEALTNLSYFPMDDTRRIQKSEYIIPQFKTKLTYDLRTILPKMGVNDIFNPLLADLSRMGAYGCYVGKAKHGVGIEVNNEGAEAAAYTIIEVDKSMPRRFVVNHPFAYTITNSDGLILFSGVVTNF